MPDYTKKNNFSKKYNKCHIILKITYSKENIKKYPYTEKIIYSKENIKNTILS